MAGLFLGVQRGQLFGRGGRLRAECGRRATLREIGMPPDARLSTEPSVHHNIGPSSPHTSNASLRTTANDGRRVHEAAASNSAARHLRPSVRRRRAAGDLPRRRARCGEFAGLALRIPHPSKRRVWDGELCLCNSSLSGRGDFGRFIYECKVAPLRVRMRPWSARRTRSAPHSACGKDPRSSP